ncbi:S-layer homology domain-containing protein [Paenibacillus sp. YYML68]|uniref:S-layer homology domain-containing protein n=1 Tax=Paenibacillus sp. YYML68 TaxID=2909250 RepID=UPI002491C2EE|nr:S-layer homology domain-containing protein [Paenibacillus sp. YYML68]
MKYVRKRIGASIISSLLLFQSIVPQSAHAENMDARTMDSTASTQHSFQDLQGHWSEKEAQVLIEKKIIEGKLKDGKLAIDPDSNVTRAEYFTMLLRSLEYPGKISSNGTVAAVPFLDVQGHWSSSFIQLAKETGLTDGYPDNTFRPDQNITRAEIIAAAVRAKKQNQSATLTFTDVPKDHWAYSYVSTAVTNKMINGYADQTFQPEASATRAEAMVVVSRFLQVQAKSDNKPAGLSVSFELKPDKTVVAPGGEVSITTLSSIQEYTVAWSADKGTLSPSDNTRETKWMAPYESGDATITAIFKGKDQQGNEVTDTKTSTVKVYEAVSSGGARDDSRHTPLPVNNVPLPPSIAVSNEAEGIILSWNVIQGALSYKVKRGTINGQYSEIATGLTKTNYMDASISRDTTYYYVVTAVNDAGESQNSNQVIVKNAPKSPTLYGSWNGGSAKLNWTIANGADRYTIYRSTVSGGPYFKLAEDLLVNTFEDTNLRADINYYYVIKGINDVGESPYSNEVSISSTLTATATFNPDLDDDSDGLSNNNELSRSTDPKTPDTDKDGLLDGYEVTLGTNPLDPDSDGDGIYDGAEMIIGTNPLQVNANTTSSKQAQTTEGNILVLAKGDGNLVLAPLQVKEVEHPLIQSINGVVGKPIDITAGGFDITEASISFKYDDASLGNVAEDDLTVYYVNPTTKKLEALSNVTIDKNANTVTGTTNHFSMYLLGKKGIEVDLANVDIVFAIDQSGSMSTNDPNYYRIKATRKFIEQMDEVHNRIGIVELETGARVKQSLTNNKADLLNVIDSMNYTLGSTNITDAIRKSGSLFDNDQQKKVIVLLTDGQATSEAGLERSESQLLADKSVLINTVALGKDADQRLLREIASLTKGGYFYIDHDLCS